METRRQWLRLGILLGLSMLSGPGVARSAWDDIRADLFGSRPIEAGQGIVNLKAPYRAIGQMHLTDLTNDEIAAATQLRRRAQLDIKHPQNTGLQMNQVTMMFIPLRFITRIEVRQADQLVWTMDAGMTLSENPRIVFDYWVNGAGRLRVRTEDTRHAVWEQSFPIGSSS